VAYGEVLRVVSSASNEWLCRQSSRYAGSSLLTYTAEEQDLYQRLNTPQFEVASGLADLLSFSACNFLSSRQRLYCPALAGSGSS
jgi:hypothetical protein